MGDNKIVIEISGDIYSFILKKVVLDDEGEYIFIVINKVGNVLCIGKFLVRKNIIKLFFFYVFRDIEVIEKSDVRLEVRV